MSTLSRLRLVAPAALLLALCPFVSAQDTSSKPTLVKPAPKPDEPTTLSLKANLVNLPVVIRDKKGVLVPGLTKADFVLNIDKQPQTIRYFDVDKDLPLTLGLLVDVSGSVANQLDAERSASGSFLDKMLTPGRDKAFLIQFAAQTELVQDLTGSVPKLQAALRELGPDQATSRVPVDPDDNTAQGGRQRRPGTVLYDAAFLAADEIMAKQTGNGRKALILLTDGEDRNSKVSIAKAIEAAQRSDTIIYAIYFKGEQPRQENNNQRGNGGRRGGGMGYPGGGGGYPGGGGGYPGGGYPGGGGGYPNGGGNNGGGNNAPLPPSRSNIDGKKILERITDETGGRTYEVTKKYTVADIYTEIAEELRSQYRLAFTPGEDQSASGFHRVELTLPDRKFKDFYIQTRDGYYTGK